MIDCYFLSLKEETPNKDYWDYGLLEDFISGNVWRTNNWIDFETHEVNKLPPKDRAIVVVPARHHSGFEYKINKMLQRIDKVVLFLMGDEEAEFEVEKIQHNNIQIWVQNAHPGRHDDYNKLGTTYPIHIKEHLKNKTFNKTLDLYFSGQITHKRRTQMLECVLHYEAEFNKNCLINRTRGFTQGVSHEEYYKLMAAAKVVPAPSGTVVPDSFRLFEALECMCIPIADEVNPSGNITEYWDWLLGEESPFPKLTSWDAIYGIMENVLQEYPNNLHQVTSWWIKWKRNFAYKVMEFINE